MKTSRLGDYEMRLIKAFTVRDTSNDAKYLKQLEDEARMKEASDNLDPEEYES